MVYQDARSSGYNQWVDIPFPTLLLSYNNSSTLKKIISNKIYNFDQLCLMTRISVTTSTPLDDNTWRYNVEVTESDGSGLSSIALAQQLILPFTWAKKRDT